MSEVSNKSKKRQSSAISGMYGRFLGFIIILLVGFPILSLYSYDWHDVPWLHAGAVHSPSNLIGLAGAVGTWCGYALFGLAVWMLPFWMILFGWLLLLGRLSHPWRRVYWASALQLCICALFELAECHSTTVALNIKSAGGAFGWLIMTVCLNPLVGAVGGALVVSMLMIAIVGFGIGWHNWHDFFVSIAYSIQEHRLRHADERERLDIEQKKLTRQIEAERRQAERDALRAQREAEKEAKRQQKEDRQRRAEEEKMEREKAYEEQKERLRQDREREEERRRIQIVSDAQAERVKENNEADDAKEHKTEIQKATDNNQQTPAQIYELPTVDLLAPVPKSSAVYGNVDENQKILTETLREFRLDVEVTHVEKGPVVTTFELLPAPGIRPEQIASMAKTIEMRLKATSIRIEAPIPGKGVVGVEIPNEKACAVTVREILEGPVWHDAEKRMSLPMLLGKDASGHDLVCDLAAMPHMLVAGATGSGKSVCMNAILTGLLMSRTPDELRLILVDPKVVEFTGYNAIPHLVVPIITDPKKVSLGLIWAIQEMEKRYKMLSAAGVKNIASFNNRKKDVEVDMFEGVDGVPPPKTSASAALPDKLPYIVIVIDELADLMLQVGREIEDSISRLAAKARAVGIHLILATQRPTVNVVTGTIKANIAGRIAFQVAAKVDSKTILDRMGAESLIGHGDMLFLNPRVSKITRAQGAYIGDDDAENVTDFIRRQAPPRYMQEVQAQLDAADENTGNDERKQTHNSGMAPFFGGSDDESMPQGDTHGTDDSDEQLYKVALDCIRRSKRASTSSLQRALRIGYNRAGRIMEMMEERGIVGPSRGANPREILVDLDGNIPANSANTAFTDSQQETNENDDVQDPV